MQSTLFKIPTASFRKIENPYDGNGTRNYLMVVNIKNLPKELDEWREINVRAAKLSSSVAKGIMETLDNNPDSFFFKNRGITIIANSVKFNNQNNIVELELTDKYHQGLLDGGHTFSVIQKYLEDQEEPADAFVRIEILEGFSDKDEIVNIVAARNKSTQVQEQGIQDLLSKFNPIKEVLKGQPYAEKIYYKEFELDEEGCKKTIDIKDILSYLLCFNTKEFGNDSHPTKAYTQKTGTVKQYAKDMDEAGDHMFEKLIPLLPDILILRDTINEEFKDVYNRIGRKFASLQGIKEQAAHRKPVTMEFTGTQVDYRLPSAYVYPILAAFRAAINCDEKKCEWITDPVELFRRLEDELITRLADQAKYHKNPDKVAKDPTTWRGCYDKVRMEILENKTTKP